MAGETNQVKVMLEEQLLVLSDIVIEENFRGNGSVASSDVPPLRRRARERLLIVKEATVATVDSVQDVPCPSGTYVGISSNTDLPTDCLNFNNTILLEMINEPDVDEKVAVFENAMQDKIAEGWLVDNFDLEEALKPPPPPTPSPTKNPDRSITPPSETIQPQPLSIGAIIGIIAAVLACFFVTIIFGMQTGYRKDTKDDDSYDLERQTSVKDPHNVAARDGLDPLPVSPFDDESESNTTTDRSWNSKDPLLQGQLSSTAQSRSLLGELPHEGSSEVEESIYSMKSSDDEHIGDIDEMSPLASMAAASTIVASSPANDPSGENAGSPYYQNAGDNPFDDDEFSIEEEFTMALAGATSGAISPMSTVGTMDSPPGPAPVSPPQSRAAAAEGRPAPSADAEEGGLGAGAAAAIGAAGAGIVAAGAYAATRSRDSTPSSSPRSSPQSPTDSKGSATSIPSAMEDLDNAIEAGNWGHVGALAAVLASQGHGSHRLNSNRGANTTVLSRSEDGSTRSGRSGSRSGSSLPLDQARALEIDKLVESGDWQGVVLAAARFEADTTFDGESSYSASGASQSSRWTGSATSATTPRSMATTDQSTSNISSQRGQAEIRAEVEALVRRVVPEEADNIDEMMTQFKGREEELVETLRRMQERAIASRARLAVQKSAKLEAKAKATPQRRAGSTAASSRGISSGNSVASDKSELEQAIEAGNWQAVGAAAQRMSDQSVGELSVEEKARLREAWSKSPAFNRHHRPTQSSENFDLDALIERGDWTGVIAAAKSASEERITPDISVMRQKKSSQTEEEDALAQANMWQEIADQSKPESKTGPAGAGDAAAWAIQRSLRALDDTSESGDTGMRTIADIVDEPDSGDSQYESSSYGDSAGLDEYMRGI